MSLSSGAGFLAFLFLAALARADSLENPVRHLGRIAVDSEIPEGDFLLLADDLAFLDSLPLTHADPAFPRLLGLTSRAPGELRRWLEARLRILVAGDVDLSRPGAIYEVASGANYPFRDADRYQEAPLLGAESPLKRTAGQAGAPAMQEAADNLGTSIYDSGKDSGKILGVLIPGIGSTSVDSPRIGLVRVDRSLFLGDVYPVGHWDPRSRVMSVSRLGVLFHEARHGDGHGVSLGFNHAHCPKGHRYQFSLSCDRNLNGPYSIEAAFYRFALATASWKASEHAAIDRLIKDTESRVLTSTPGGSPVVDPTMRRISWAIARCEQLDREGKAPASCRSGGFDQVKKALADWIVENAGAAAVPSRDWDPAPESVSLGKR